MPLDDAMDWDVMGPKYRARVIELEAARDGACISGYNSGWHACFDSTIERCAKVVREILEEFEDELTAQQRQYIVDQISRRALKEKP